MHFGEYWIIPIVKTSAGPALAAAREGDIMYVSYREGDGAEKEAANFYQEQLTEYQDA